MEDLAATHKAKTVLLRVALGHTLPGQDEIKADVSAVREAEEYLKPDIDAVAIFTLSRYPLPDLDDTIG